ncbi:cold-shock protein [Caldisericum sp.]|uniref:cold-shock protein n=1 Tax=Caldisericum sp. TaxID=2499687 RepID=UPI003D0C0711
MNVVKKCFKLKINPHLKKAKVIKYFDDRKFGFIKYDNITYFFHISNVRDISRPEIKQGDNVFIDLRWARKSDEGKYKIDMVITERLFNAIVNQPCDAKITSLYGYSLVLGSEDYAYRPDCGVLEKCITGKINVYSDITFTYYPINSDNMVMVTLWGLEQVYYVCQLNKEIETTCNKIENTLLRAKEGVFSHNFYFALDDYAKNVGINATYKIIDSKIKIHVTFDIEILKKYLNSLGLDWFLKDIAENPPILDDKKSYHKILDPLDREFIIDIEDIFTLLPTDKIKLIIKDDAVFMTSDDVAFVKELFRVFTDQLPYRIKMNEKYMRLISEYELGGTDKNRDIIVKYFLDKIQETPREVIKRELPDFTPVLEALKRDKLQIEEVWHDKRGDFSTQFLVDINGKYWETWAPRKYKDEKERREIIWDEIVTAKIGDLVNWALEYKDGILTTALAKRMINILIEEGVPISDNVRNAYYGVKEKPLYVHIHED